MQTHTSLDFQTRMAELDRIARVNGYAPVSPHRSVFDSIRDMVRSRWPRRRLFVNPAPVTGGGD